MARKHVSEFGKHSVKHLIKRSVKHSVKKPKLIVSFTWTKKKPIFRESPKKPSGGGGQDEPSKSILDSPVPAVGRKFLEKLGPRILVAQSQAPRSQREEEGGGQNWSKVFSMVSDKNSRKVLEQSPSRIYNEQSTEVSFDSSREVSYKNLREVSFENSRNIYDENSSKVTDNTSSKVINKNSSNVSDNNSNQVSDDNSSKVYDKNSKNETDQSLLPLGWRRLGVARKSRGQEGKVDYYILTERGRRFRSQVQLDKWLQEEGRSLQVSLKPEALKRRLTEKKAGPEEASSATVSQAKHITLLKLRADLGGLNFQNTQNLCKMAKKNSKKLPVRHDLKKSSKISSSRPVQETLAKKIGTKSKLTKVPVIIGEPVVETVVSKSKVYCVCRAPDYGGPMVGCDGPCRDWYHFSCLGWGPGYRLAPGAWYCHTCVMVLG